MPGKQEALYSVKLARLANLEDAWSSGHPSEAKLKELQALRAEVLALASVQK